MRQLRPYELVAFRLGRQVDFTDPKYYCTVGEVFEHCAAPVRADYRLEIRRTEVSNDVVCLLIASRNGPDDHHGYLVLAWLEVARTVIAPDEFMRSLQCAEVLEAHQKIRTGQLVEKARNFWSIACLTGCFIVLSAVLIGALSMGVDRGLALASFMGLLVVGGILSFPLTDRIVKMRAERLQVGDEVTWSVTNALKDMPSSETAASQAA